MMATAELDLTHLDRSDLVSIADLEVILDTLGGGPAALDLATFEPDVLSSGAALARRSPTMASAQ